MIGKILLILLGAVLLAIAVLLLIPLHVRISYEKGVFNAWMRYGTKMVVLYPGQEKDAQAQKMTAATAKEETPAQEKTKNKPNWEQISYSLEVLPRVLLRALRQTGRRITITPLKLHLLVAGIDPADVAILYGKLQAVLAATLPPLHKSVQIREQDIQLFPDFCEEQMDWIADIGIQIRPWDILVVASFAAGGILKWYIGFKKRADKSDTAHRKDRKATVRAGSSD